MNRSERAADPRQRDSAFFQGLPKAVKDRSPEFGRFIQEQDPVMGEGDLTRPRDASAADQAGVRNAMVRRAKGPDGQQWTIRGELGSHAVDMSGLDRKSVGE